MCIIKGKEAKKIMEEAKKVPSKKSKENSVKLRKFFEKFEKDSL